MAIVEIIGQTGTYQEKTVTPSTSEQSVTPDTGYDALSRVVVSGDEALVAENIKKDVEIFGVTGMLKSEVDPNKPILFYDQDQLVESWSLEELASATELPPNPTRAGLISQGWNWSLSSLQNANRPMNVGQTYVTDDGTTRLYINLEEEEDLSVDLYLYLNSYQSIQINWGDSSAPYIHGNYSGPEIINHQYSTTGEYVISITTLKINGWNSEAASGPHPLFGSTQAEDYRKRGILRKVEFGTGLEHIDVLMFSGCHNLENVTIPNGIEVLRPSAFRNCLRLKSITIPNRTESDEILMGEAVFHGCSSLEVASLPENLYSLEPYAFAGCSSLKSSIVPVPTTRIENSCFAGNAGLRSAVISSTVSSISDRAFYGCSGLLSVSLPSALETIGDYAFSGCTSLQKIDIPSGVTTIGDNCFFESNSLISVDLKDGLTSLGASVFEDCTSLQDLTIPNSVTSIGKQAFRNCTSLQDLTLSNSLTSILSFAFGGCTSLQDLTIPNSVTSIETFAFYECTSLQDLTLSNSLTNIGMSVFTDCTSLRNLTIPNSVTNIGFNAFIGCTAMEEYHFQAVTPPTLGGSAFSGIPTTCKIYVPMASVSAYKAASGWSTYAAQIFGE